MVMVISDCIRALLVFWIFFVYQRGMLSPWVLFFVTIAISLIEAFHMPAGIAVIQHVLPEEHYDKGISINVSFTKIAVLAGTGLSGLVINWLGIGTSLLIDSIIFFVSAFLIIKLEIFIPDHSPVGKGIGREYIVSLKDGFTYVFSHKNLLNLCFLCILINSAVVPFDALLAPIASEMFHGDAQIVSLLSVSVTLGTICGSLAFAKMQEKRKTNLVVTVCGIVLGAYYIFMVLISGYIASAAVQKVRLLIGSVVIGIALGLMITYVQVKFVKEVAKDYIGRVSAIRYSLTYACAPIVSFLLSAAYQAASVETDFVFICSGFIIIFLFAFAHMAAHFRSCR